MKISKKYLHGIIKFFASGLGLGFLPRTPGTWGTLLGLPIFWFINWRQDLSSMIFIFLFTLVAILIAELAGPLFEIPDSPHIVIDEVAGFLVTVVWLPKTWQTLLAGFILFRILDIWKPGPIRFVERRLKGGVGVVMDDVVAGILGNIILQTVYTQTVWLGN